MNENPHTQTPASKEADYGKSRRPILHLPASNLQLSPGAKIAAETDNSTYDSKCCAGDKFASCDDSAAPDDEPATPAAADGESSASEEIATATSTISAPPAKPNDPPPNKTGLELAIERLTALGDKSETMMITKWGKRNAAILTESLNFLAAYEAASEAEQKAVRKSLKTKSGVSREPNADNLPVIAVYMGVSCAAKNRTKAQRKEWCRFATVVKVAAKVAIKPEDAAQWLEKKTLNGILAEWRDMRKSAGEGKRKPPVPKALKDYTHLAAALANGSTFRDLAAKELAKADAAIAEAMMKAAPPAPETSVVSPAQEAPLHA